MANTIDYLNPSLYYQSIKTNQKTAEKSTKKTSIYSNSFFNILKSSEDIESSEVSLELAKEIQGLSDEEAFIHLKDNVDIAGDNLKNARSTENFLAYKKALAQFLEYSLSRSYEMKTVQGIARRSKENSYIKKRNEYRIIHVIDEKIEQLATEMLYNHHDNIYIANRVDEIKGLLIDLFN